jgi:hypothetical protein
MDVNTLTDTLRDGLDEYDKATEKIRRCLPAFETACSQIIGEIGRGSLTEAESKFDQLLELQGVLSKAVFIYGIDIGERLMSVAKEFERLHDPYIRDVWFKKIKDGITWPDSRQ